MKRITRQVRAFVACDRALSITEYGMLVAFIAFVLIAVVVILGGGLSSWFAAKTGNVTTV